MLIIIQIIPGILVLGTHAGARIPGWHNTPKISSMISHYVQNHYKPLFNAGRMVPMELLRPEVKTGHESHR